MGTTETLAKWIVETSYEDIPPAAYEQAKKSILDVLGTTILGSTTDIGQLIIGHTQEEGGNPQARVIATDIKTTSANAAFANGTMGHADDFDDLGGIGGHPAIVLTPPSLA
ncbi:MAG: MmgE/PrpD family protein, partial [SAR202 cluster bacterium]|nr:MmgE/PrpD family protein [SAR202 cluster bacterium]